MNEITVPISELRKVRMAESIHRKELQELRLKLELQKQNMPPIKIETTSIVDPIKQATLQILEHLDDIDKQALVMWGDEDHPNVIRIKTMTKAMRDEIETMIYNSIKDR